MPHSAIDIRPVQNAGERKTFIRLVPRLYSDDPNYVAPLEFEVGARLDPAKNPSLKSSPTQLWVAYRDDAPVGRVAAVVNHAHQEIYHDDTGHFGFLEGEDDPALFHALMDTAGAWLRDRGMKKMAGPYNFSVNEECGMLIDGFDTPPYFMMPHGRPYYAKQMEALGFTKARDMYALRYIPRRAFIPEKRMKFVNKTLENAKVKIRNLNTRDLLGDIQTMVDIFNDAWSDNWGFIPFTPDHARQMASELRPIIQKHNLVICEYQGEPAAFGFVVPNLNKIARDFGGKLFPFNWAKLIWRLKIQRPDQARMPLMGVRKRLHRKPVGAALAYKIIDLVNSANIERGVTSSELSWILENNEAMITMLQDIGGDIYKTYRIYEKPL